MEPSASETPNAIGQRPSALRTLRFALRGAWDALGLVCATSLTVFFCGMAALIVFLYPFRWLHLGGPLPLLLAAALAYLLVVGPLSVGACVIAHQILAHDETSYADLWRGCARGYPSSVALAAIHLAVASVLGANLVFYLSRGSFFFLLLAALFFYLTVFWLMSALYHAPLLAAGEVGILSGSGGFRRRITSVVRNGFLLAVAGPGYTLLLLIVLMLIAIPLAVSGVGLALVYTGAAAFISTQAARDQLVRFGVLPPPPDPDAPIENDAWKLR